LSVAENFSSSSGASSQKSLQQYQQLSQEIKRQGKWFQKSVDEWRKMKVPPALETKRQKGFGRG